MDGRAVLQALFRAVDAHDIGGVQDLASSDFVGEDIAGAEPYSGPAGAAAWISGYLEAFPDLGATVVQTIVDGAHSAVV